MNEAERAIHESRERARELLAHVTECQTPDCSRNREQGLYSDNLHVHHKDGNPLNNALHNLIKLCVRCHVRTHRGLPLYGDGPWLRLERFRREDLDALQREGRK